jgi:23S rRNA (uridine2552-2'-O)-methyltransferase
MPECYTSPVAKKGTRRQDHLARRAQKEGFRARSVYKLAAINQKFELFHPGDRILDLGAAPGSWSQFLLPLVGRTGAVVAVDLQEFTIPGAVCRQGDFTDPDVRRWINEQGPYSHVISDAAPATTGNRIVDTARSEGLVESILAEVPGWLQPGGAVVCKVFQGGGQQTLLQEVRRLCQRGYLYRPQAVRSESFETYLVGIGYSTSK